MEAAAETVKQLTRAILPERPHQLAPNLEWKARQEDSSRHYEEWKQTRLQYMTLLSDADRGILFTRGYDDIRPEPPKPVPKEVNALARGGAAKKLSLSDYKNKKTGATASASPPDSTPSSTPKKPFDRASATPLPDSRAAPESKTRSDSGKSSDGLKPPVPEPGSTAKRKNHDENITVDMRLPPKPPRSLYPPRPSSPGSRKRPADLDDAARPPKRPKPTEDDRRAGDDRSNTPRDEALRRKPQDRPIARDSKDGRPVASSSSLPNGRATIKNATSSSRTGSPPPRPRGNSINGARSQAADSNHGTPKKGDASKASVPPLLSPLHFDIEGNKDRSETRRLEKKRSDETADTGKTMKSSKNAEAPPSAKRPRSPLSLEPLLSPTLPPEIEEELERRKKASPKVSEDRPKDKDASSRTKKVGKEQPSDVPESKARRPLIVTLRVPKVLRREFRLQMKLGARKEPPRSDRPSSASVVAQPSRAEKRPALPSEQTLEPSALKRPRASDVAAKGPIPPSTPSKKASTAMSRVSSNNSMTHTPGEAMAATPSVPGSSDRAGHDRAPLLSKAAEAKIKALKEREELLRNLGRNLKHKADRRGDPSVVTNGNARQSEGGVKMGYALILESVAAFMMGFHAQDVYRGMRSQPSEPNSWSSLFPLIEMLQKELRRLDSRRNAPIYAITLLLQAVSWDQLLNAWATREDAAERVTVKQLLRAQRSRSKTWTLFSEAADEVDGPLRVSVFPWTSVEEVVESTLRVLRRWCADEGVDWSPELNLRESGVKTAGQT